MPIKTKNHPNLTQNFPPEVQKIFQIFLKQGDEIKLVGGCVRDLLANKPLNDFDFATKLLPQDIIKTLQENKIQAIPTGIKFGTITAVINGKNFEITTLRKDVESDGRHCQAQFVDDYFEDAKRRDFTINALYLDEKGTIQDYFNGIEDLDNKEVKFIGAAAQRIEEDFLRILRFFRFSCDYAKSLNKKGMEACIAKKEGLKQLSVERIRVELLKLIASQEKDNLLAILRQVCETKIMSEIVTANLNIKALEKLFALENKLQITASLRLKMAALFLEENLNLKTYVKEMSATNAEKHYLQFLLKNVSQISQEMTLVDVKIILAFEDKELVADMYVLHLLTAETKQQAKETINFIQNFVLPSFPINGEDLKSIGFKKEQIGIHLTKAKTFWATKDFKPNKDELMHFVQASS